MFRFRFLLLTALLAACSQTKPGPEFYGIPLSATPTKLSTTGFACKSGDLVKETCSRFDANPTFLGEAIGAAYVNFISGQLASISLELSGRKARMQDLLDLSEKISAVYERRESKMNRTGGGVHQEHWNGKDGSVIRLTMMSGSSGVTSDTTTVTLFPRNQVTGDL